MKGRTITRRLNRRSLLLGVGAFASACGLRRPVLAGTARDEPRFFLSLNLQGLEGGSKLPGVAGTDYFVPSPSDLAGVAARTTGPWRLPFSWERLQPTVAGPLDELYLGQMKSVADAAAALQRSVILDCHNYMHRLVDGTDRYVDGSDGILTRAHLADLWFRIATHFGRHPGVAGWDIMNEPQGSHGPLAKIMRAVVSAIDAAETRKTIYVDGGRYSSAAGWGADNPEYPLVDAHDRIVYSAHCYPDFNGSGTHFDYASELAHNIPDTVLVDRSRNFLQWCHTHKVRGHIGETNVGIDDPRWSGVLERGLGFWKDNNIPVDLWLYARNFGPNPYNLFPYSGVWPPQWAIMEKIVESSRHS